MDDSEKQFLYVLDSRVDVIGERVSKIEGKLGEKSTPGLRKVISEYGGVIGLALSIVIGLFTLHDKLVTEPEKEKVQKKTTFRNNISQLTSINATIAGLDRQNPQALYQLQAWTPQRLAILEQIKADDKEMPNVLKPSDRMLIAQEYEFFNKIPEALEQIELAEKGVTDVQLKASLHWSKARLFGQLNKPELMRENFLQALQELKSTGLKTTAGGVMQLYIQWIYMELANGTCETATSAYSRFVNDFNLEDVWPATKQDTRMRFKTMLSQSAKSCGLRVP